MSALSELSTVSQEHPDFPDTIREIAHCEGTNEIPRRGAARTFR
jgi:hypothetical protein